MFKLFSLEGATKMIPVVDAHLHDLQEAIADLKRTQAEARQLRPGTLEAHNAQTELGFLLRRVHDARVEVQRLGVQVPDIATGVVEFPSRVDGEVVHLVWERGHGAITHYHRLTGDEEPMRLDPEGDRSPALEVRSDGGIDVRGG